MSDEPFGRSKKSGDLFSATSEVSPALVAKMVAKLGRGVSASRCELPTRCGVGS